MHAIIVQGDPGDCGVVSDMIRLIRVYAVDHGQVAFINFKSAPNAGDASLLQLCRHTGERIRVKRRVCSARKNQVPLHFPIHNITCGQQTCFKLVINPKHIQRIKCCDRFGDASWGHSYQRIGLLQHGSGGGIGQGKADTSAQICLRNDIGGFRNRLPVEVFAS